jgi:hypothetical protein
MQQVYYQNCYIEILSVLLLSLYLFIQDKTVLSALFLSLAIGFKIFLLPLFFVPLLVKEYKLFFFSVVFFCCIAIGSVFILGFDTHVQMIKSIFEHYPGLRRHGITFPFICDGFAGYQDLFNKLHVKGYITPFAIQFFTVTAVFGYGLAGLWLMKRIHQAVLVIDKSDYRKGAAEKKTLYLQAFGTLLIFIMGFNFRFDHGTLLVAAVPFIMLAKSGLFSILAAVSITMIAVFRHLPIVLIKYSGCKAPWWVEKSLSEFFFLFPFQFIGITILVISVFYYWLSYSIHNTAPEWES